MILQQSSPRPRDNTSSTAIARYDLPPVQQHVSLRNPINTSTHSQDNTKRKRGAKPSPHDPGNNRRSLLLLTARYAMFPTSILGAERVPTRGKGAACTAARKKSCVCVRIDSVGVVLREIQPGGGRAVYRVAGKQNVCACSGQKWRRNQGELST